MQPTTSKPWRYWLCKINFHNCCHRLTVVLVCFFSYFHQFQFSVFAMYFLILLSLHVRTRQISPVVIRSYMVLLYMRAATLYGFIVRLVSSASISVFYNFTNISIILKYLSVTIILNINQYTFYWMTTRSVSYIICLAKELRILN